MDRGTTGGSAWASPPEGGTLCQWVDYFLL